jgi:hypothetical protein
MRSRGWRSYATAEVTPLAPDRKEALDTEGLWEQCSEVVEIANGGSETAEAGPRWNCLRAVRRDAGLWAAELAKKSRDAAEFALYPLPLDDALMFSDLRLPSPALPEGSWSPPKTMR